MDWYEFLDREVGLWLLLLYAKSLGFSGVVWEWRRNIVRILLDLYIRCLAIVDGGGEHQIGGIWHKTIKRDERGCFQREARTEDGARPRAEDCDFPRFSAEEGKLRQPLSRTLGKFICIAFYDQQWVE